MRRVMIREEAAPLPCFSPSSKPKNSFGYADFAPARQAAITELWIFNDAI